MISSKESDEYYNSRPLESRIGALASSQSEILSNRSVLMKRVDEIRNKYLNSSIPRPSYWNGYRVKPSLIEFWEEKSNRLHDRVEFSKTQKGWVSNRLFP